MIGETSARIPPGAIVRIYDREGNPFGAGFFNGRARVPLRVFHHGADAAGEDDLDERVSGAAALRLEMLRLPEESDAWRVVFSDADRVPGFTVDKFGDTLAVEVTTLGAWQRLDRWLRLLHAACGTTRHHVGVDPAVARIEGITGDAPPSPHGAAPVRRARFQEHGVRFEADFAQGHKTGFFCDQRENRFRLARWVAGRPLLDLCCYTGGFSLAARVLGGCPEVTAVDLDENAIAQARRNANLNQTRVQFVHADAFTWARQMRENGRTWPAMVLDPPKFIVHRDDRETGIRKYEDLNRLALSLLARDGLFVTCSCSGHLDRRDFEDLVIRAAHRAGRRLQILDVTGAGPDHPVASNCPETRYLKVVWARAW